MNQARHLRGTSVLRAGLWIFGIGFLSLLAAGAFGGNWGPCGPSNGWAMIFFLAALVAMPPGLLVAAIGILLQVWQWISERPPSVQPR